ncbi:MAG: hypothetical protein D3910_13485 [Candidatus Electrothrix sp. ATG2]|nr:hypothetical protein [Candidatus Electrothrix sp. ATG2]
MYKNTLFVICMFFLLPAIGLTAGCTAKGRVVDAATGEPIEGASIAIRWIGHKIGPPYASGEYIAEEANAVSGDDGYFTVPKHYLKSCEMGVYKKGYVCWSNTSIFQKGLGDMGIDRIVDRVGFRIADGMVVELEPFTEEYPRPRHASFVRNISRSSGGLDGIGEEIQLYRRHYLNK